MLKWQLSNVAKCSYCENISMKENVAITLELQMMPHLNAKFNGLKILT